MSDDPPERPKERLYRDDAGAALERVARLEAENAQLRQELAERSVGAQAGTGTDGPGAGRPHGRAPRGWRGSATSPISLAVLVALASTGLLVSAFIAAVILSRGSRPTRQAAEVVPPATAPAGGRSYESAVATLDGPPEGSDRTVLSQAELAAPLNDGSFLVAQATCGALESMRVTLRVAVQNGRAEGVSVFTTPRDEIVAACIDRAVRTRSWPAHPTLGKVTVAY